MKKIIALLLLLCSLPAMAQTYSTINFNLWNFTSQNVSNRSFTVVPVQGTLVPPPGHQASYDGQTLVSDGSGNAALNNVIQGLYTFTILAPPQRYQYLLYVPTNAPNTYTADQLIVSNSATLPTNIFYTAQASDARFLQITNLIPGANITIATNTNSSGFKTLTISSISGTNAANVLTNDSRPISLTNSSNQFTGSFTGNGSGLSNVTHSLLAGNLAPLFTANFTVSDNPTLTFAGINVNSNTFYAGGSNNTIGLPSFRAVYPTDLPWLGSAATNASTNFSTNYFVGNRIFVSKTGNDATGVRNDPKHAFLTIGAAKSAALAGDLIGVEPGVWVETNLLKPGVNYWLWAGCFISNTIAGNDTNGWGIFDDRPSGPTTNYIYGHGSLYFCTGITSNANASFQGFTPDLNYAIWTYGCSNAMGAVVVTNPDSKLIAHFSEITYLSFWNNSPVIQAGINIKNSKLSQISFDRLNNGIQTNNGYFYTSDFDSNWGLPIALSQEQSIGVYWAAGEMHLDVPFIDTFGQYAIWANQEGTLTSGQNLYFNGDLLRSKIYQSGTSTNLVGWYRFDELNTSNAAIITRRDGFSMFGGKAYIMGAGKIVPGIGYDLDIEGGTNALWVESEKFTSATNNGTAFINIANAFPSTYLQAHVLQYDDVGGVTAGIANSGGEAHIQGGTMVIRNGKGVNHSGGSTFLDGVSIDTTTTSSTNNQPILVSTNGLYLRGVNLRSPANTFGIYASSAQTVNWDGSYNGAPPSANITLSGTNWGDVTHANTSFVTTANVTTLNSGSQVNTNNILTKSITVTAAAASSMAGFDASTNLTNINSFAISGSASAASLTTSGAVNAGSVSTGTLTITNALIGYQRSRIAIAQSVTFAASPTLNYIFGEGTCTSASALAVTQAQTPLINATTLYLLTTNAILSRATPVPSGTNVWFYPVTNGVVSAQQYYRFIGDGSTQSLYCTLISNGPITGVTNLAWMETNNGAGSITSTTAFLPFITPTTQ